MRKSFSQIFIDHPRLAWVIVIIITLCGAYRNFYIFKFLVLLKADFYLFQSISPTFLHKGFRKLQII